MRRFLKLLYLSVFIVYTKNHDKSLKQNKKKILNIEKCLLKTYLI